MQIGDVGMTTKEGALAGIAPGNGTDCQPASGGRASASREDCEAPEPVRERGGTGAMRWPANPTVCVLCKRNPCGWTGLCGPCREEMF